MAVFEDGKNVKTDNLYDIAIIGAGPAGLTAAIYAIRDNKNVILFEKEEVGGQALYSSKIVNIPGFPEISGYDFIENLKVQLDQAIEDSEGSLWFLEEEATNVVQEQIGIDHVYHIETEGNVYYSRSVIVATGSKYRTLGVPGEEELIGRGISFCSTCDAPFYKGRTVAVIGGGNSAVTEALELAHFAKKVYILQNLEDLTAEKSLLSKLEAVNNIEVRTGVRVDEFSKNVRTKEIVIDYSVYMAGDYGWVRKSLVVGGVFLAIGMKAQNKVANNIATMNPIGYIRGATCWDVEIAGDCLDKQVRQIATACGDGARAAVEICRILNERER